MRRFFDTNVLVYMFDDGAPEKRDFARECFRTAVADGSFVISTQDLQDGRRFGSLVLMNPFLKG